MDPLLKTLLIELAETTLKVLNPQSLNPTRKWTTGPMRQLTAEQPRVNDPVPTPWATATVMVADRGEPQKIGTQNPPAVSPSVANPQTMQTKEWRGSKVRVWTGDRYEVGTVDSLARDKCTLTVRIDRGEGRRDKIVKTHREKAVLL